MLWCCEGVTPSASFAFGQYTSEREFFRMKKLAETFAQKFCAIPDAQRSVATLAGIIAGQEKRKQHDALEQHAGSLTETYGREKLQTCMEAFP